MAVPIHASSSTATFLPLGDRFTHARCYCFEPRTDELRAFESVARRGEYIINVGMVQKQLFQRLAQGTFSGHEFTTQVGATEADGSLLPVITELQFSTPRQTRTDYYGKMRYRFDLYDQTGTKVGSWDLPAYGKANQANYSNDNEGLNAAAISACRDMAAMFSLNFANEPKLSQWIQSSSDGSARPKTNGSNRNQYLTALLKQRHR